MLLSAFHVFSGFGRAELLVRTTLLNQFYSTAIMDIRTVAGHIADLQNTKNIGHKLSVGDVDAVTEIALVNHGGKIWNHVSFASKFASFHNPNAYPILDSLVLDVFCELKRRGFFVKNVKFSRESLRSNYQLYKDVYDEFMQLSGINVIQYNGGIPTYKDVDNYLWASRKIKSLDTSDIRALQAPNEYNNIIGNVLNTNIP